MIKLSLLNSLLSQDFESSEWLKYSTDSRTYTDEFVFFAITGEKFNAVENLDFVLKNNCPVVIYTQNSKNTEVIEKLKNENKITHFIAVEDTIKSIQELATMHIEYFKSKDVPIIAISGSNGKTTHKEMLGHILTNILGEESVVITQKNNNNHLGVPFTILQNDENTKAFIIELGSNHPGEIKVLCEIAKPNYGITTNIGSTHLEFFIDEEAVFKEEAYLHEYLKQKRGKVFLINSEDRFLKSLDKFSGALTYGMSEGQEVSFSQSGNRIYFKSGEEFSNENIFGDYNFYNLAGAVILARLILPNSQKEIFKFASSFRPTFNRAQWVKHLDYKILMDAYNANPSSMKASLSSFQKYFKSNNLEMTSSVIILGSMNELGPNGPEMHRDLAKFVDSLGFNRIICVGHSADLYLEEISKTSAFKIDTLSSELDKVKTLLKSGDYIFLKGSRSLQLESILDIT
jgi:UDP-N-acetylmuramoyl-tripeptide--D-alanyl-D-alanine ligase